MCQAHLEVLHFYSTLLIILSSKYIFNIKFYPVGNTESQNGKYIDFIRNENTDNLTWTWGGGLRSCGVCTWAEDSLPSTHTHWRHRMMDNIPFNDWSLAKGKKKYKWLWYIFHKKYALYYIISYLFFSIRIFLNTRKN